jgi:penicillin-binding protein 2
MLRQFRRKKKIKTELFADEILADASNIPEFNRDQMEGRLERPLSRRSVLGAGVVVTLLFAALVWRAGDLQIAQGATYAEQAQNNQLASQVIFADRGIITDRNGTPLAWNVATSSEEDFAQRVYANFQGLAHAVGYVQPPAKDSSGVYFRDAFTGMDGAEKAYNDELAGQNGLKLTETDARGAVVSESVVQPPVAGQQIALSLDANVTQALYNILQTRGTQANAQGAAGIVMNVKTGEILAMTSWPEYSQTAMTEGDSAAINSYNTNPNLPFLDRAVNGLYAPGSIVKPIMATAGLTVGVITPETEITSTGQISLPNPFDPSNPSIFKDWRVNGTMTVRDAIAVSSDVFFYEVGGGYQNQPGIGIDNIDKYFQLFGFGTPAPLAGFDTPSGTIPSPAWKAANFPADPEWRIGDTYHTSIGQYGTQITPLQAVREAATIANGGTLMTPTLIASSTPQGTKLPVASDVLEVVREGMREGVTTGISTAVNFPFVEVAAKTGTAQVGSQNQWQNAWMIGFWPYQNPEYAYAVVLEKLPAGTSVGGSIIMNDFFNWLHENAAGYLN